jgi:hypothetical protein
MNNNDIICLTETGAETIGELPGFKIIHMPRDYNSRNAGVSVLTENSIAGACSVKRMHPQLGIMWINISIQGHEKVFLACCYLPHQYSNRHLNSNFKVVDHFNCLNSDIEEFNSSGKIVICGDLNSRTGSTDDRLNIQWDSLTHVGNLISDLDNKVPKRVSCDKVTNIMGKHLLNLCKDNNIVILNGRLQGDKHPVNGGSFTFEARGRKGNSLIDYFIASPELAFDNDGVPRDGNSLRVSFPVCIRDLTDHGCVALRVHIPKAVKKDQHLTNSLKYNFRPEIMETFSSILHSEEMSSKLACIGNDDLGAVESYALFNEVITDALQEVHKRHGKVIASDQQAGPPRNGPTNPWYNEDCRKLRKQWKDLQQETGIDGHATKVARAQYRNLTRRLSREAKAQNAKSLIDKLKKSPRLFWKKYKGSSSKSPLMNVEEWAKYFASTFQSSEHAQIEVTHVPEIDIVAASMLNIPISETEVHTELTKLQRNKAVGVDGIPAEFYIPVRPNSRGRFPFFPPTQNILVPIITKLFNRILSDDYPTQCADSAITPIPKSKGSLTEYDNYRGIAVGSVLPKIFSMVLNTRGNKWAETNGKRAVGQFGFRPNRSTADAAFVLRHTVEVYQSRKKPVYCAFIDFRKAYDSVNRNILWNCLEQMGIHGNYLNTLRNMYKQVRMRVRVGSRMSSAFLAEAGVKTRR